MLSNEHVSATQIKKETDS